MEEIIKVENLKKSFGKKVILDKVNVVFKKGESTAILGSNGSGKSTFIRMLCGLSRITEGKIIKDKKLKFNYIPENYSKIELTIDEYLKVMGDLAKIKKEEILKKTSYFYERFNLENLKDVPMKNLSKGSLQKAAIIQALIDQCDVLLLDEPMTGLDLSSQKIFVEEVNRKKSQGITLIMSCHEPYLVNNLCDRILRIENKNLILSEIKNIEEKNTMIFNFKEEVNIKEIIKDYGEYQVKDHKLKVEIVSSKSNEVLLELLKKGYVLEKFN